MAEETKEPQTQAASAAPEGKKAPATFRSLLGVKRGMTQVFTDDGKLHGVTVVEAGPCTVLAVRTPERDRYKAVQLAFGSRREKNMGKALVGQFKKAGFPAAKHVREFRVDDVAGFEVGQIVDMDRFTPMDYVDVRSLSKGRGFAGVMKRHNFAGLPGSHGASDKERSPGSLTSRRALGRVLPGQRMAGHMGHEMTTVHKIEVVKTDPANHFLFLKGSVPGPRGSLIMITETVKNRKRRIIRKVSTVLRDKMGNIIQAKGAKAAAKAAAAKAPEKK
ncbi:MAG: 50S ribosomal protein L3 [Elusimicrobia bacterium]|nr:50S ribosomal protein L3 [Elusimicrobiota bacterium]